MNIKGRKRNPRRVPIVRVPRALFEEALVLLENREWLKRNAAENIYCPDCETDKDRWSDQQEHHEGCPFVRVLKALKRC